MLKPYHYGAIILGLALSNNALAVLDCSNSNKLNPGALVAALQGHTVCVGSSGNWEAQEEHLAGGLLGDYHSGPNSINASERLTANDPASWDPTDRVGTWNTSGNKVTYTYSELVGGTLTETGSYEYTLHYDGDTYTF